MKSVSRPIEEAIVGKVISLERGKAINLLLYVTRCTVFGQSLKLSGFAIKLCKGNVDYCIGNQTITIGKKEVATMLAMELIEPEDVAAQNAVIGDKRIISNLSLAGVINAVDSTSVPAILKAFRQKYEDSYCTITTTDGDEMLVRIVAVTNITTVKDECIITLNVETTQSKVFKKSRVVTMTVTVNSKSLLGR